MRNLGKYKTYQGEGFGEIYRDLLIDLKYNPMYVASPRGQKINEITNCVFELLNPRQSMYMNDRRSSQFAYIAAELVWYFMGREDLDFIKHYAKFWEILVNDDGTLNSAYGNLIFREENEYGYNQYKWAYDSLVKDKDSRQAIMHFNKPSHQYEGNKDFVCTLNGVFMIRNDKLNFTIMIRSNDVILGLPTDIAFFTKLQEQMLNHLRSVYPELEMGKYTHIANSMHLYERNFELVNEMLKSEFHSLYSEPLEMNFINVKGQPMSELKKLHNQILFTQSFKTTEKIKYEVTDKLLQWIWDNIKK